MMTRTFRNCACLLALSVTMPAGANVYSATSATLQSVWSTAGSGDTIVLAGTFAGATLADKTAAQPITIIASAAIFTDTLKFSAVNGVKLVGGTYDSTFGVTKYGAGIYATNSKNLTFDQNLFIAAAGNKETGISLVNVANSWVTNATFNGTRVGVGVYESSYVTLTGNTVTGATSDGYDIFNDHNVLAYNNVCTGSQPSAGAHPDCVQLSSKVGSPIQSDIRIVDNIATGDTQGFNAFTPGAGGGIALTLSGNIVNLIQTQGIACYGCIDSFITGNYLSAQPGAPHFVNVNVVGGSNNTVADNHFRPLDEPLILPPNYAAAYLILTGTPYVPYSLPTPGLPPVSNLFGAFAVGNPVPEPAAWALMLIGFATIGMAQRRRTRTAIAA